MARPLAYHLTWTAYGTWLPGDQRGWVDGDQPGILPADLELHRRVQHRLADDPVEFDDDQRQLIERTLQDHARIRGWTLHAVNVRSNHVHLIVTGDATPETMLNQFKAWCSRRLSDAAGLSGQVARHVGRKRWFTEHGSTKWINDEMYLANAIHYVLHGQ